MYYIIYVYIQYIYSVYSVCIYMLYFIYIFIHNAVCMCTNTINFTPNNLNGKDTFINISKKKKSVNFRLSGMCEINRLCVRGLSAAVEGVT